MKFKDKSALITGCNRGIGFSILKKLAKDGCNIIAHSRLENKEFLKQCQEITKNHGISITHIHFYLNEIENLKKEIKKIIKNKIPVDFLINSAGIIHGGLFQMTPVQEIKDIFNINFLLCWR